MKPSSTRKYGLKIFLLGLVLPGHSLVVPSFQGRNLHRVPFVMGMGLYDKPLSPLPSPQGQPSDESGHDDESIPPTAKRLFDFDMDGREKRNLLPRLSRSLESGIGCYFEASDRIVQNLVSKTDCHPDDAAWALEACKGDITEAWTRISTARRMLLNQNDNRSPAEKVESSAIAKLELDSFREKLNEVERKRKRDEYFSGGKLDAEWLPRQNPKPVDDEPWFTG